ncbi:MAG: cation-translocating P-type ATPase [Actinomycetia bacterium]|nr:cation-translocating P-type ATPase [Actinomycetes bacterium]
MNPTWADSADDIVRYQASDVVRGLSTLEVGRRLLEHGPNELAATPPEPRWRRLLEQFNDPLVLLLVAATGISLAAWASEGAEETPLEAIVIGAIIILNAILGYWQEAKAVEAVAALSRLTALHATVLRDGDLSVILSSELVPGDILLLGEGDAVGADCRIVEAAGLQIAEAPLTGESAPVAKMAVELDPDTDLAERSNMVFKGTAVARGRGRGVVVATGMATEIGRIASLIESATEERTPLQRQIDWLGRVLGLSVIGLSSLVVGAIVLTSEVSSASDVLEALLVGVSLAVAAVPEGLPAIMTVVLALGVQRMASHKAVVKKLSSVETLGSASVICSDKTGTLTRNEMTVVRVVTGSVAVELTGSGYHPVGDVLVDGERLTDPRALREVELVLGAGSVANDARLQPSGSGRWEVVGDPTEIALLVAQEKLGLGRGRQGSPGRVGEIPFDSDRKLMTVIHRDHDGDNWAGDLQGSATPSSGPQILMVTKGAPEVLLDRCTHIRMGDGVEPLTEAGRAELDATIDDLADRALRTLAVAYRPLGDLPSEVDESLEDELVYLGAVGIIDPPRPEAAAAIAEAQRAGIRIMMITGDHPRTAARIGADLGIAGGDDQAGRATTGGELGSLDDDGFHRIIDTQSVFARVAPEHKLRIVRALQEDSHVVAMTGDGVNDAPALKQADIGVAMGINGTEVSKEAADMILADDNFATILDAVREGREIFANIRKFLRYLLASNTGEVLVMLIGVLAAGSLGLSDTAEGLAVPLLATQILWINLLTDSTLALALGVDPSVEDVMDRPPRDLDDRVIDTTMLVTIGLIGVVTALAGLAALDLELAGGLLGGSGDLTTARTMAFTTLVLGQVFNAFNARSDRVSAFVRPFENRLLWAAAGLTVALQLAVVHLGPLNRAFDTTPLDLRRWLICWALASTVLFADEIRKLIVRRRSVSVGP